MGVSESEVEPAAFLGEEGMTGVEGADVGARVAFHLKSDARADGIGIGCFAISDEEEGEKVVL